MAQVHRAVAASDAFQRSVALKRMLSHIAGSEDMVKSFVREARLASYLRHENVAQTYDLGRVGDTYFIVMELITGRNLREVLKHCGATTGPMPVQIALNVLNQICDALDYAHNLCDETGQPLGIIHRDVSPSNVIVSETGVVKLIDFGIAKASGGGMQTMSGTLKGKFAYMAPEYIGGRIDARADLFAVGVIAHELLTNRPLFSGRDDIDTLSRVRDMAIAPPSKKNPQVPPEIDDIVMTALARDPARRWQHATALRTALTTLTQRLALIATNMQVVQWLDWAFSQPPKHSARRAGTDTDPDPDTDADPDQTSDAASISAEQETVEHRTIKQRTPGKPTVEPPSLTLSSPSQKITLIRGGGGSGDRAPPNKAPAGTPGSVPAQASSPSAANAPGASQPAPTSRPARGSNPPTSNPQPSGPRASSPPTSNPATSSPLGSSPPASSAPASRPPVSSLPASGPRASTPPASNPATSSAPASRPSAPSPATSSPATSSPATSSPATSNPATSSAPALRPSAPSPVASSPATSNPPSNPPASSPPSSSAPASSPAAGRALSTLPARAPSASSSPPVDKPAPPSLDHIPVSPARTIPILGAAPAFPASRARSPSAPPPQSFQAALQSLSGGSSPAPHAFQPSHGSPAQGLQASPSSLAQNLGASQASSPPVFAASPPSSPAQGFAASAPSPAQGLTASSLSPAQGFGASSPSPAQGFRASPLSAPAQGFRASPPSAPQSFGASAPSPAQGFHASPSQSPSASPGPVVPVRNAAPFAAPRPSAPAVAPPAHDPEASKAIQRDFAQRTAAPSAPAPSAPAAPRPTSPIVVALLVVLAAAAAAITVYFVLPLLT